MHAECSLVRISPLTFSTSLSTWLVGVPHRHHHAPALGELLEERRRHARPARRDQDAIERRLVRPAERAVRRPHPHVVVPQLSSIWRARAASRGIRSTVHTRAASSESTAAWYPLPVPISSTFSRPVRAKQLGHPTHDEGLRDRLPVPDRQRMIAVRPIAQRLVHEQVARHAPHRREHPRLRHPARHHLLLHHALALAREALRAPLSASGATDHRGRFFSSALRPPSHSAMRPSAPKCVRSRCSGVTDAKPACTAAMSEASSSCHSGGPTPIQ